MCIKSKEELDDLLKRIPDRQMRRKALEGLSGCGNCELGRALDTSHGEYTCEYHLAELRNMILHQIRQIGSEDRPLSTANDESGNQ